MTQKEIYSSRQLKVILERLACQLVENHGDFSHTAVIGIQTSGVILAEKLCKILTETYGIKDLRFGKLDITFFRDDFRSRRLNPAKATVTQVDFLIEDLNVIIVDDVLHTGRSVRAALTALNSFGRPKKAELLVLIDRRFSRDLPIQPDYKGLQADVFSDEKITVDWTANQGQGAVYIRERATEK